MTDWIEHDGKGAPNLPEGTKVAVRMGDGWTDDLLRSHATWEWWDAPGDESSSWFNDGHPDSITAYRVVSP